MKRSLYFNSAWTENRRVFDYISSYYPSSLTSFFSQRGNLTYEPNTLTVTDFCIDVKSWRVVNRWSRLLLKAEGKFGFSVSDRRHKSKFISLLLICVVLVAWELKIATADALIDVTARLELDAIESVHYLSFPTIAKIFIWEHGVSKDFPRPLPTLSAAVSIWEPLKWQICEYQLKVLTSTTKKVSLNETWTFFNFEQNPSL